MKKTMAIMTVAVVAGTMSVSAELLVGWETWGAVPLAGQSRNVGASATAADTTGSVFIPGQSGAENVWQPSTAPSNSTGNYGATLAGASRDTTAFNSGLYGNPLSTTGNTYLEFSITYAGTQSLKLDMFHFDGSQGGNQATRSWTLEYYGATTNVVAGPSVFPNFNGLSEEDIDISGLGLVLNQNESATFRMSFVGNGNGGNGQRLDNVAISGTVIPEPATLGLVISMGGGLLFIRRRFMI